MDLMDAKKMSSPEELEEYAEDLRGVFPPGSTAHTILRHVSSSGTTRYISVLGIGGREIHDWSYRVAAVVGRKLDRDTNGIKVEGCGMDMGFELVYNLSSRLYPDGFDCIGGGCPANDHVNGLKVGKGFRHPSGGYAISQRWL